MGEERDGVSRNEPDELAMGENDLSSLQTFHDTTTVAQILYQKTATISNSYEAGCLISEAFSRSRLNSETRRTKISNGSNN